MKDTYTREEILTMFLEAHKASEGLDSREQPHFILGWLIGGLGIADEYRAATKTVTR